MTNHYSDDYENHNCAPSCDQRNHAALRQALESSARQRRPDMWIKHCLAIHLAQDYADNYAEDNYAHTYTDQNLVAVR
jgi:hypothetical protein